MEEQPEVTSQKPQLLELFFSIHRHLEIFNELLWGRYEETIVFIIEHSGFLSLLFPVLDSGFGGAMFLSYHLYSTIILGGIHASPTIGHYSSNLSIIIAVILIINSDIE